MKKGVCRERENGKADEEREEEVGFDGTHFEILSSLLSGFVCVCVCVKILLTMGVQEEGVGDGEVRRCS